MHNIVTVDYIEVGANTIAIANEIESVVFRVNKLRINC